MSDPDILGPFSQIIRQKDLINLKGMFVVLGSIIRQLFVKQDEKIYKKCLELTKVLKKANHEFFHKCFLHYLRAA